MRLECAAVIDTSGQALFRHRGPVLAGLARSARKVLALAPPDHAYAGMSLQELREGFESVGATFWPIAFDRLGTNPLKDLRTFASIVRALSTNSVEFVLSFTPKGTILGSSAAAALRVPRVYTVLPGLGYLFGDQAGQRPLLVRVAHTALRQALRLNKGVFVQNPDHARLLVSNGFVARPELCFCVAGAGVDPVAFGYSTPRPGPPRFLFMSRLYAEKGVRDFADAARLVLGRHPRARFQILGALDDRPCCLRREELQSWTRQGVIEYLGHTADVRPYLASCSVLVLPSYYQEGIPSCIVEAMMTGRPVITTDWPGCREPVIPNVTGMLVPPRDPHSLAAAMCHYIERPRDVLSMGVAARALATEKFSTSVVVGQMLTAMGVE